MEVLDLINSKLFYAFHAYNRRGMIRDPLPNKVTALENFNVIKIICGSD